MQETASDQRDTKLRKKFDIITGKSMQTRTPGNDTVSGLKGKDWLRLE